SNADMTVTPRFNRYRHGLLDRDGCVWVGEQRRRGAPGAIAELRDAGKSLAFLTNDPRRSPEEYVRKLWTVGIRASLAEVVAVGGAIQHVLAQGRSRPEAYVIGAPPVFRHVSEAGMRSVTGTPKAPRPQPGVIAGH